VPQLYRLLVSIRAIMGGKHSSDYDW
jgi:hypothetical protein